MYNNNAEAEDFDTPRDGIFNRIKRTLMGHDEWEEEETEGREASPAQPSVQVSRSGGSLNPLRKMNGLRLDTGRRAQVVTVRRAVQSFDDARRAADGLKSGEQQIINLEQTPNDMAERIIDFLNGATYALDGSVEKIGEQVYLFTPASVIVDVEDKPSPGTRSSSLLDRD